MAACCSGIVVGSSEDHVRDVALDVAGRQVDDENDIHTFKRPDYTAEECVATPKNMKIRS